jgi:hypothetical protein
MTKILGMDFITGASSWSLSDDSRDTTDHESGSGVTQENPNLIRAIA